MASDDFSIKTKITLDTKNYEAGIKKAESATQKFSSSLSGVTKLLKSTFALAGISVGTKAIVNFGKEAVKSAESANKTLNILNNTLKVTGASAWTTSEDLVKMSEEIAYSTNYTVGEIQDMQSVLLGFKNITGDTFREASDAITDMATVMGMDLKSAVQTVGKALDDPIKGLDSLRRQGFAFTEEQKEQLKQLVENGEQLKAQKIILDELNTTYGGSAKSAQSSFDKQRDAVISFKETLGNQLIPVLDVFAEKSATSFSTLTEKIKTIDFSEIAGTVEYSVQVITEYFGVFYNNAKELVKGLTERFGDVEISLDIVKEAVYNSLNNIYKQMQISFGFMRALINGDWKLAWEYAKIYVLDVCKKILDGLDDLLTKMPDLVNGAIKGLNAYYEAQDKVLIEWFHLPEKFFKAPRLGTYDGKNFIDTSELQKQIDEATRIIEEATGKQVTINLTGLEQIDTNRKKYQKIAEKDEIHFTSTTEVQVNKRTSIFEKEIKNIKTGWSDFIESLKKESENWTGLFQSVFTTMQDAFGQTFIMLGENLVGAGHEFEDFASVALNALAEVLKALGSQLSAIAVVKAMAKDYGDAMVAVAGATSAFVASGIASGFANKMGNVNATLEKFNTISTITIEKVKLLREEISAVVSGLQYTTASSYSEMSALLLKQEQLTTAYNLLVKQREDAWNATPEDMRDLYLRGKDEGFDDWAIFKKSGFTYWHQLDKEVKTTAKDLEDIASRISSYYKTLLDSLKAQNEAITDEISSYKTLYGSLEKVSDYYKIILEEQKTGILNATKNVVQDLTKSGASVGDAIINALINGGTKKDFLSSMKDYIRENLIKLAVYTESFQNQLAEVGVKITSALLTGGDFGTIRSELENLWQVASTNATKAEEIIESVFGDIGKTIENTVIEINAVGESIGNTIFNSILNGAERSDFLLGMKNFMRENLLKLAVYTDEFKYKLKEIGEKIGNALIGDMTEDVVSGLRTEIETLYDSAIENAKRAENLVSSVFGDIKETVEETVEETLTKFENLMKSFKESVSDVGGEIGQTFVDSIANGMSQGDFLDKMKSWIKRMLVQSVVYTESMKAEIEAIGQAITKGIREGFTETSLHEIRRDLSWVFNEANETISSLDNILDKTFGGYAIGTNNALSGLHLVGEAGPELVRFRGGEQVLNASNTQKALEGMSGTTINQNVTFNNLQDTTAYAMMNQFKQYNRSLAINGVI